MSVEQFTNDAITTLVNTIAAGDTTITVQSTLGFPTTPQFRIRIDNEILLVTAMAGATWTVTRAVEMCQGAQTAVAHASGATIAHVLTSASIGLIPTYGTVTTVSIITANGVSGSVANPTTTPALTISLGNITPTSVAAFGAVTGSNLSGTNTGDQFTSETAHTLIGNPTGGVHAAQEITLGNGLAFSGTNLIINFTTGLTVISGALKPYIYPGEPTQSFGSSCLLGVNAGAQQVVSIGVYIPGPETIQFGSAGAANGYATFSDGATGSAARFEDASSIYEIIIGSDGQGYAFQARDGTNTVTIANGSQAIGISGNIGTNQVTPASSVGTLIAVIPVYDLGNILQGYIPVYDSYS